MDASLQQPEAIWSAWRKWGRPGESDVVGDNGQSRRWGAVCLPAIIQGIQVLCRLVVLFGTPPSPPALEVPVDSMLASLAPPDLGRLVRADKLLNVAVSKIFAQIPVVDAVLVHFFAVSLVLSSVYYKAMEMH